MTRRVSRELYPLSDAGRRERRDLYKIFLWGFPVMLFQAAFIVLKMLEYFSEDPVLGWIKIFQGVVLLSVFIVLFGLVVSYASTYKSRRMISWLREGDFSGDLFLVRRSYGLCSDLQSAMGREIFNTKRDEYIVLGIADEGLLLWSGSRSMTPRLSIPYEHIYAVREGLGKSAGGKMIGILLDVRGPWSGKLTFLLRGHWLFGMLPIRVKNLRRVVAEISKNIQSR